MELRPYRTTKRNSASFRNCLSELAMELRLYKPTERNGSNFRNCFSENEIEQRLYRTSERILRDLEIAFRTCNWTTTICNCWSYSACFRNKLSELAMELQLYIYIFTEPTNACFDICLSEIEMDLRLYRTSKRTLRVIESAFLNLQWNYDIINYRK
jgi:hypothetical protein